MVVGEPKRSIMDGIENTGDVRLHDHRLRLKQRFDIIRKLGQGTYGKVQLGINKKTGQEVAIKTIKKCKIETEADLVRIRREVQIMSSVRHPNIVHIYEVFENSEKMILVMEYCSGGELYDYLSQQKVLKEDEARRLFRQIATACYYCHKHKICHRDLKLENVLLDEHGSAKIADFGLSNVFEERRLLSTFCGSPLYASPEIVKGTPYIGPEVDCWSLGVLLYTLVYGAMPFDGSNFKRLVKQISTGDYFEPKTPSSASPLIRDMLTVDPIQRADITHICDHPWVNKGSDVSCLELAESLANETPVRLDLLLSLAPPPVHGSDKLVVTDEVNNAGVDASPTHSMSMASIDNSAERRILEMVAEGGTDAIKPSPTRTLVSAADQPKRKLETTVSMDNAPSQRKKERSVRSSSKILQTPAQNDSNETATLPANNFQPSTVARDDSMENRKLSSDAEILQDTASCKPNEPISSSAPENHSSHPNNETPATINRVSPPSTSKSSPVPVTAKKEPKIEMKTKDPALKEKNLPSKPTMSMKKKLNTSTSKTNENKSIAVKEKSPPRKSIDRDPTSPTKNLENKSPSHESNVSSQAPSLKQPTERRKSRILDAAEKLNNLTIQPSPVPESTAQSPPTSKPKRVIIPGVSVGSFKEQFERRASLTSTNIPSTTSEPKKPAVKVPQGNATAQPPVSKTLVDKKMHSVDSEHPPKQIETKDPVNVRLQSIGVEPSPQVRENMMRPAIGKPAPLPEISNKITKPLIKSESLKEPSMKRETLQNSLSLEDARRSLQQSMALISQAKGDYGSSDLSENGSLGDRQTQLKTAREIISNAIGDDSNGKKVHRICMGGKPPVPYGSGGRSASGSISLNNIASPPTSPPHTLHRSITRESPARTFRTEVQHRVDDVRNKFPTSRGGSVERIIPIHIADEAPKTQNSFKTHTPQLPYQRNNSMPFRLGSIPRTTPDLDSERTTQPSTPSTPASISRAEPIKKSPREFIIPIAVEGVGYVTPRQGSLEPSETPTKLTPSNISFASRFPKPRRLSSLVSGGESEDEDDMQMHRLRSSRRNPADAEKESVSSGEEDDDEGFVLLTAENLFSTLLDRVRDLTNRLNGEEGTGFPQHHQSLFNNLHSPFFNSPHLPRKHKRHNVMREGPSWRRSGTRDITSDFDSMFPSHTNFPRGSKKSSRKAASMKNQSESSHNNSIDSAKSNTRLNENSDTKTSENLDLSDLDLSKIELSDKEMETLSGLTPALSRRLQKQLLAHLPPAAARTLRRTLSMNCPNPADTLQPQHKYTRSLSASKSVDKPDPACCTSDLASSLKRDNSDVSLCTENQIENTILPIDESKHTSKARTLPPVVDAVDSVSRKNLDDSSTKMAIRTKESHDNSDADSFSLDKSYNSLDLVTEKSNSTSAGGSITPRHISSVRNTPERSVLSKYFSPEKTTYEDYSSLRNGTESGSLLSEPSYMAAYGGISNIPQGGSLRRRSLRTPPVETPTRRRVSRFLRPDFFDTPREESVYIRDKRDKELETQKILKEIRQKKNRVIGSDASSPTSPASTFDVVNLFEGARSRSGSRSCLSPVNSFNSRDVSRSVTPFYPILDNINEIHNDNNTKTELQQALMAIGKQLDERNSIHSDDNENSAISAPKIATLNNNHNESENLSEKESRIVRPKSFPCKPSDDLRIFKDLTIENNSKNVSTQPDPLNNNVNPKESKITRPKSYPICSLDKTLNDTPIDPSIAEKLIEKKKEINIADSSNNNAPGLEDNNGNITVSFSVNLPSKNVKTLNSEENVVENSEIINGEEKKKTSPKKKKIVVKKKSTALKTVTVNTDSAVKSTNDVIGTDKTQAQQCSQKTDEIKLSPIKKKSVLSSIGEKFEKFRNDSFHRSNSQEKESTLDKSLKPLIPGVKEDAKVSRIENVMRVLRERSVPTGNQPESITESGLIKRAVTITDLPTLEAAKDSHSKKGVNRVLGLFKKIETKDKISKTDISNPAIDKEAVSKESEIIMESTIKEPAGCLIDPPVTDNKAKRPTSLLLNGIGKRVQACYSGATSDSALNKSEKKSLKPEEAADSSQVKVDDVKSQKKGLRLDFSRLPRLNQGIFAKRNSLDLSKSREGSVSKESTENHKVVHEQNGDSDDTPNKLFIENGNENSKQNDFSNEALISPNWSPDCDTSKFMVDHHDTPVSPGGSQHPQRTHEGTSPDPENIVDRIRRKSFYSRFNEKKNRRKSLLVGPGAKEYIPSARIHSHSDADSPSYNKYDSSPTSPSKYSTSPVTLEHSRAYQTLDKIDCLSPSTSRLRSIVNSDQLPLSGNKSLERHEIRYLPETKYSDNTSHYSIPRYSRTVSLFDNFEMRPGADSKASSSRYGRTFSQLSPGNYATYSPRAHSRNSAILLRENGDDTESSKDSVLAKIRSRKTPTPQNTALDDDTILDSKFRSNSSQSSEHDLPVDKVE